MRAQGRVDGSWLKNLKQLQKTEVLILDRLVHNAHRLVLQGESMRKNNPVVENDEKTG
jgi:DNA replication protein DnaC